MTVCGQASSCFLTSVVEREQAGQVSSRAGPLLAWKISTENRGRSRGTCRTTDGPMTDNEP